MMRGEPVGFFALLFVCLCVLAVLSIGLHYALVRFLERRAAKQSPRFASAADLSEREWE